MLTQLSAPPSREPCIYGERDGFIIDPFGHGWALDSHIEDVARATQAG